MKKKISCKLVLAISILAALCVIPKYAFATFSIDAEPYRGGSELIFSADPGTTAEPREVKIKITTDVNKRYEVKQVIVAPVDNGRGDEIDWRNFSLYGLLGSNTSGTLHVAASAPVRPVPSIDRLYTSATNGPSDEFILVYNLSLPPETPAGSYRGKIKFILNPLVAGQNQAFDFLNFVVDVGRKPGEVKPQIEITPVSGLNTIYLNSKKEDNQTFDVEVKINKDFNTSPTIYQMLMQQPQDSATGNQLDYGLINYVVSEVTKGRTDANKITPFSSRMMNIYRSEPNGQVDNDFIVTYSLGDLSQAKAGRYRGKIQYYLEQEGKSKFLGSLDLEVENERIFELLITPEEQRSAIEFRNLKPKEPPKKSEVILEVKTNIGKAYQVSQNVFSELTDKEGNTIPFKYFTLTLNTESLDTKGILKITDKQNVRKGDAILFVSDGKGSPDKFKIIYELAIPWEVKAGDYSTRITYSLLEI